MCGVCVCVCSRMLSQDLECSRIPFKVSFMVGLGIGLGRWEGILSGVG